MVSGSSRDLEPQGHQAVRVPSTERLGAGFADLPDPPHLGIALPTALKGALTAFTVELPARTNMLGCF